MVQQFAAARPATDLVEAYGINNAGSIVGDYIDDASIAHGLLRTP